MSLNLIGRQSHRSSIILKTVLSCQITLIEFPGIGIAKSFLISIGLRIRSVMRDIFWEWFIFATAIGPSPAALFAYICNSYFLLSWKPSNLYSFWFRSTVTVVHLLPVFRLDWDFPSIWRYFMIYCPFWEHHFVSGIGFHWIRRRREVRYEVFKSFTFTLFYGF